MAKLSRSAFLYSLGATGVFIMTGCGSGTTKNTTYGGSYRSAYTIPQSGESGFFEFTVDIKGNLSGTLDNELGKVREVSGTVESDGTFQASTSNLSASQSGRMTGRLSDGGTVLPPGSIAVATPIIGGVFTLVENSATLSGTFQIVTNGVVANSYRATYSDSGRFPNAVSFGGAPFLANSTSAVFNIDQQGLLLGTLGTHRVEGRVASDGQIVGTVTGSNGTLYSFQGIINKQIFFFPDRDIPGVRANLIFTVDGQEYSGNVSSLGGDGLTQTAG